MFAKGAIAVGALAAALALLPGTALAGTHVNVGIGLGGWGGGGGWCFHHHACGMGHPGWGWRHRFYPNVAFYGGGGYYGDGYYGGGYYDDAYQPPVSRIGCGEAKAILADHGFSTIHAIKCGGAFDVFDARRGSHHYVVKVDASTGGIVPVSRD